MITFTSPHPNPYYGVFWEGIKFYGSHDVIDNRSKIQYSIIEYARMGVNYNYDSPTVTNNIIQNNDFGLEIFYPTTAITVSHNRLINNSYGMSVTSNNSISINYNTIIGSKYHGIKISSASTQDWRINHNNIVSDYNYQAKVYDIYLEGVGGYDIDASNNWWGTTDIDLINSHIYDYQDDLARASINYQPIVTSEIPDAGVQ